MKEKATELEWLEFFYINSDFGPADGDVRDEIMQEFMDKTGKALPDGWNYWSSGEEIES